jgi:septal ring factor EnvC (AmiA/AmiB activator)
VRKTYRTLFPGGVKTSEIKREIKSAQDEINKTKTGIAERRKDQQRLDREITELRAQLSRVPADQKAQRDVVEQRLSTSEAQCEGASRS